MTISFDSGAAASRRSAISRTTSAILRTRSLSLSLSSATVIVLLASAAASWGQLDANDPWPKESHNERNTCYAPKYGPHAVPTLHWWSKAGYGATTDANAPPAWRGGAAIAKIQGVRCVFVCGRDPDNSYIPTLYAFRFYPCDAAYDPTMTEAPALAKIALAPATEQINSTPLILPSDRIVVQTTKRVLCYDFLNALTFNPNNCALQSPPLIWQYYPTDGFVSEAASPALGYANNQGEPGMRTSYIFVAGNLKRLPEDGGGALEHRATLVALDPLTGTGQNPFVWQANLDDGFTQAAVTPAIGPIDGDSALRNFVYVATFGNSSTRNFFACYSDNSAAPLWADLGRHR